VGTANDCILLRIHMHSDMRTTLVLDDDLIMQAKQRAAEQQSTLSEVVNQALRDHLLPSTCLSEAPVPYRALTFGDPEAPVAMEPSDLARLDADDDRTRLGY
jgi:Arc/MetJ family transcription regulator